MERINITLPPKTARLLERAAPRGSRSRLIAEAVEHYLQSLGRKNLRARLKEGAIKHAGRDRELTAEWFLIDEKVW
ncbi:MAG: hypothetical protein AAB730_00770 [Patescibacteria group bacterium]